MADLSPELRRITEDSVRRRTGKGWDEWLSVLDDWGGGDKDNTEIAEHLRSAHGLSPWWAQAVAVRYEYERGLRKGD